MIYNKFLKYYFGALVIIILIFQLSGCSYSFTGASVPPHLKTIAIPLVMDRSGSAEPNLSNDFTNDLIQKFIDDNNLEVTDKTNADALLECTITSIKDTPEVVASTQTQSEKATERRITINVKVVYKDLIKKQTILNKDFSNYSTYDASDFVEARGAAISETINNITEDILLAVVSNW